MARTDQILITRDPDRKYRGRVVHEDDDLSRCKTEELLKRPICLEADSLDEAMDKANEQDNGGVCWHGDIIKILAAEEEARKNAAIARLREAIRVLGPDWERFK